MKRIYKFRLGSQQGRQDVEMPEGARVLSVAEQENTIVLWAIVDPDMRKTKTRFLKVWTGHEVPDYPGTFIGTVQLYNGTHVVHVFQKRIVEALDGTITEL